MYEITTVRGVDVWFKVEMVILASLLVGCSRVLWSESDMSHNSTGSLSQSFLVIKLLYFI